MIYITGDTHADFTRFSTEVRRLQTRFTWWAWWDSPTKISSVLHSLQTGIDAWCYRAAREFVLLSGLTLEV